MYLVQRFKVTTNSNRKPLREHRGLFNSSYTKELAVLTAGKAFETRDIALHSRDSREVRISETHHAYDTLQYPLIFLSLIHI